MASGPESLDGAAGGLSQEKGALQKLGLTKEVLAAHTQRERAVISSYFMRLISWIYNALSV